MELINQTPYSYLFYRTALKDHKFAAAVLIRVTYSLKNGKAFKVKNQILPLSDKERFSEFGPIESDLKFRKGGVDILIFGKAVAPNRKPIKKMKVVVVLKNKIKCELLVFGDRNWVKQNNSLVMSEPKPFVEMPLSLFNSYGGKTVWDELEINYPRNPYGKGFYWDSEDATNKPLPNIENPKNLIEKWNDQPIPVGVSQCPIASRIQNNIDYTNGQVTDISPKIFNTAFPDMIANEISYGDRISILGVTAKGDFDFTIPNHKLFMKLKLGKKEVKRNLNIDEVGIFPNNNSFFITYRFSFRYIFRPFEKRICELYEMEEPLNMTYE